MKKNKNKMMKIESKVGMLFICIGVLFLCFAGTVSAKTWYVPDDHSTIQAAVDAANAGDTIIVRDGLYTENVFANKRLTIQSENGADSTTVQAARYIINVFGIYADHVNVSGFTIKGPTDRSNRSAAGIRFYGAENCNISNNLLLNNYNGIVLYDSSNNIIAGNDVNSNNAWGITLSNSLNNIITSNNVSNNRADTFQKGISLYGSQNNVITGNNVSNNWDGISLYDSSSNIIIDNNANSNNGTGISLWGSCSNTLTGNNASNNRDIGIGLRDSSSNTVISNSVSNNGGGIILHNSSNNNIYLNNFIDNYCIVYSKSSNIWNSTSKMTYIYNGVTYENYMGNYWSGYTGSDANNDGIGDTHHIISDYNNDNYPLMGHWENYVIEIIPATPIPSPVTPTVTSIATPSPSPTPRTTPTTSGFGVFFAIAGLLAVAYLLRMRK